MAVGFEIERRFLIERPDVSLLCSHYDVEIRAILQTYLVAPEGYSSERVRRVAVGGEVTYTHTRKRRVARDTALEEEETVDEARYQELLLRADPERRPIEKQRVTFCVGRQCYEIDLYPFFERVSILETELSASDDQLDFPSELVLIREITGISSLSNHALARQVPSEESLI